MKLISRYCNLLNLVFLSFFFLLVIFSTLTFSFHCIHGELALIKH